MRFTGICRTFPTLDDRQYETIGAFWDELSAEYGRANLRGLGYSWTADSIKYVIGLKDSDISGFDTELELPDDSWITVWEGPKILRRYTAIYTKTVLLHTR